jgi:DNA recombination protein RmuC
LEKEKMAEILPLLTLGTALIAAVFALLAFLRAGRGSASGEAVTQDQINQAVRGETDRLRKDVSDQSRELREEVGNNIRGFQETIGRSFKDLGDTLGNQTKTFGDRLDDGIKRIEQRTDSIAKKLDTDIEKMAEEANKNREILRQVIEAKLDDSASKGTAAAKLLREEIGAILAQFQDTLVKTGSDQTKTQSVQAEALATRLSDSLHRFGAQQQESLETVVKSITALAEKQTLAQEDLRKSVEGRLDILRTENAAKLDEMRKTVDERLQTTLEKRLGDSFKLVSDQLEQVQRGLGEMQTLAVGVGDLKKVLTNVKTRGTWGEIQLGALLEQILAQDQFIPNAQVKEGSGERVEFAIRLPGRDGENEVLLPIDAKFPQEDFERLVLASERADPVAVEEASNALETRVRTFARTINEKYINSPKTTDFAILFLPTEGLYAELLRRPGFFNKLQQDYHVTLTGPTTLTAVLNALQMGFRTLAIQKRSSEVWQVLGAIRTEFGKYGETVERLKKQLDTAANTVDSLGQRSRAMSRKLQDVQTLPEQEAQRLLGLGDTNSGNGDDEGDD